MVQAEPNQDELQALRELLDRSAVQNCINLYFHALDSRDFSLFEQVFAPEVEIAEGSRIDRETLIRHLSGVARFRVSHHGPRNSHIRLNGSQAEANTFALDTLLLYPPRATPDAAWPVHDGDAGPVLRNHGLRYIDALERRPEGWRIVKRRGPICLWRYHVANVEVHPNVDEMRGAAWPVHRNMAGRGPEDLTNEDKTLGI